MVKNRGMCSKERFLANQNEAYIQSSIRQAISYQNSGSWKEMKLYSCMPRHTSQEKQALKPLRHCTKPADKSGAFVEGVKQIYLQEAGCQLKVTTDKCNTKCTTPKSPKTKQ